MNIFKHLVGVLLVATLAACGGGGGSAGTTAASGAASAASAAASAAAGTGATAATPTVTLTIVDANFVFVSTNSIGSGATFYVKAVVLTAAGSPSANQLVTFTADPTIVNLSQLTALTDAAGTVKVRISPVSLVTTKAGNVGASVTVDTIAITNTISYQTSAANVSLSALTPANASISALQSTAVTVNGLVNGVAAGNGVVTANFSATCGTFSPANASTNGSGTITSTFQSTALCSGPVTLTATTAGATPVTATVTVAAAVASNIVFKSATPSILVSSAASGGVKQSTLVFQVVDSGGNGMAAQNVSLTLAPSTISAGVSFSVGGVNTQAPQTVTTDASGNASVTVSSGSLPTPVIVTAALVSSPTVFASSTGIVVTAGNATQNAASLAADKLSLEAFNVDGVVAKLTFRVADRQGNPVPVGSVVNFVAGAGGQVQGTCTLDTASSCTVAFTSQGLRPASGRAIILAYMDGEESFIDANGNNIWDAGETFYPVGQLFRDDNENGTYDAGTEQTYPGGTIGTAACAAATFSYPSVVNTCNAATWSNNIRVRRQITIALATAFANITAVSARSLSGFAVHVADQNGNAMPTGTTVSAAVATAGVACAVLSTSPNPVFNSPNAGNHVISLNSDPTCLTARVNVTVTTPSGSATTAGF